MAANVTIDAVNYIYNKIREQNRAQDDAYEMRMRSWANVVMETPGVWLIRDDEPDLTKGDNSGEYGEICP